MFAITITERAEGDLASFEKAEQQLIADSIERQLMHQPNVVTRNRKPIRTSELAQWELRAGDYRIFYDVTEGPDEVVVKAVGKKEHGKLFFRGQEFQL